MKSALLFVILLNLLLSGTGCSSANSTQHPNKDEIKSESFEMKGKWLIKDVVFVGNPRDTKISKTLNFYELLGSGWSKTKGKHFVFDSNNHWHSTIFENKWNQKEFTYALNESLVLVLKGPELNYQFSVIIKDSTANSMTWDIGNEIDLVFDRVP